MFSLSPFMRCDADVLPIKVVFLLNRAQYPMKPEGAAVVTALFRIQENNRGMCHLIISQKYALHLPAHKNPPSLYLDC